MSWRPPCVHSRSRIMCTGHSSSETLQTTAFLSFHPAERPPAPSSFPTSNPLRNDGIQPEQREFQETATSASTESTPAVRQSRRWRERAPWTVATNSLPDITFDSSLCSTTCRIVWTDARRTLHYVSRMISFLRASSEPKELRAESDRERWCDKNEVQCLVVLPDGAVFGGTHG